MNELTLNQNAVECIVKINNFFSYEIHNICNGEITHINSGSLDVFSIVFLLSIMSAVLFIIIGLSILFIKNITEEWS